MADNVSRDWAKISPNRWTCASCSIWGGEVLHLYFKKVRGAKARPNGRTEYCMLCPWKQASESDGDAVLSKCKSMRPLNPRTQTSRSGRIFTRICFSVNILNGRVPSALLMGLRSRIGRSPPSLLGTTNSGWKNCSPACSLGLVLSLLLHCSCFRIRAFRVSVRDYATPLKQGGLRLNWRAYPRSYAEQPAWDSWNSFSRAQELT